MRIGAQFMELRVINQLNKYRCEFKTPSNFKTQATFTKWIFRNKFFFWKQIHLTVRKIDCFFFERK